MRWKFILGLLTICAVLMSMSYTMLIPFLPMYLIQDLGVVKADVDMWSGAIFAITFLVSGIMAPIWGALADKKSRKLMALRAGFCLAITYFLGWSRILGSCSAFDLFKAYPPVFGLRCLRSSLLNLRSSSSVSAWALCRAV